MNKNSKATAKSHLAQVSKHTSRFALRPHLGAIVILLLTTLSVTALMTSYLTGSSSRFDVFEVGDIAKYSVRSPRDVLVEDTPGTERLRTEAALKVARVFVLDEEVASGIPDQLNVVFDALRANASDDGDGASIVLNKKARANFEKQFRIDLVGREWDFILNSALWTDITAGVGQVVGGALKKGVLSNKRPLERALRGPGAVLLHMPSEREEELFSFTWFLRSYRNPPLY